MIRTAFHKTVWIITYILVWPIIRIFYKIEIDFDKSIDTLKRPLILVSNHKTPFDAWILAGAIPFNLFVKILPIYIMGSRKFASGGLNVLGKMGIVSLVYGTYGVISLPFTKEKQEKLRPFYKILERGESVLIFPEGKLIRTDSIGDFKEGAAMLHMHTGVPILISSIRFSRTGFRKTCKVHFGELLIARKDANARSITSNITNKLKLLYYK